MHFSFFTSNVMKNSKGNTAHFRWQSVVGAQPQRMTMLLFFYIVCGDLVEKWTAVWLYDYRLQITNERCGLRQLRKHYIPVCQRRDMPIERETALRRRRMSIITRMPGADVSTLHLRLPPTQLPLQSISAVRNMCRWWGNSRISSESSAHSLIIDHRPDGPLRGNISCLSTDRMHSV